MSLKDKRVLITGGAGFIGSRLAALVGAETEIFVFDNFHPQVHDGNPENRERLEALGIPTINGDMRDASAVHQAVKLVNPNLIYHLAAETGTGQSFDTVAHYNNVNIMGTAHLIEAVRQSGQSVERIVLAGSRSVYGEGACINAAGQPTAAVERLDADLNAGDFEPKNRYGNTLTPVETDASCVVAPASIYASTKLMQEYLLTQAFWGTDVKIGILRLQNVYGPGQSLNNPYTGVLSIFTRQIIEGKTLRIFEDGEIVRDFVMVDDVVTAFYAMGANKEMPIEVIDIGSGEAVTILKVAQTLLSLLGQDPDNFEITGAFRPGDIRYAVANISKAKELLDWTPKYDLVKGLSLLAYWSQKTLIV